MVQIIKGGSEQRQAQERLGYMQGKTLSDTLLNYGASKAMDKVVSDKSLADLPPSERIGKLEEALRPYGEHGQQMFVNRMKIEMQRAQEVEEKKQEKEATKQKEIIGRLLGGEDVSAKERGFLSAEQNIAIDKIRNTAPSGGATAQPIPPEISQKIPMVLNANKNATADELAEAFDTAAIPTIWSNKYIENRRRQDEAKANREIEDKKTSRKEELEFHKESGKYDEELQKKTQTAKKQIETIGEIEKAISSGNIKPFSVANLFKGFGKIGDKISEAALNKDEATVLASIPQLLEGWKEVFGVRLSDADLRVLQDKLPSIGKSKESNRAILGIMKKYSDMTLLRGRIAEDIKKNNKGIRPINYASTVEERFDQMVKPVNVVNPNTGKTISIPAYQLSGALEKGAKLVDE